MCILIIVHMSFINTYTCIGEYYFLKMDRDTSLKKNLETAVLHWCFMNIHVHINHLGINVHINHLGILVNTSSDSAFFFF